eukprot:CAMPEP_0119033504 /NCGR_PEP_ID=MMETSP1177-20130426/546_1 /TAXON_ID=2985 /ORGANISM="Ochromonas sp, Strain CCMP1899" /LENGTH=510 /DNA_ID=CAMNT_0006990289 /DNA_START=229 /DNA_END=1758 /DNA_ORIENTATION=-
MTVTTADTDQGYAALKTAQNFFKDAVDYSLKGKLIEITQLFDDYLRNDCKVTARDLLNDFKSEGKTLMHVATSGGHSNIVDYFVTLLKSPKGIKDLINAADDRGYTPLINATISESDSIMKTLIQHGADINAVNKDGAGAIHFAAGDGNVARLILLTEKGANILTMSQSGNALHWAAGKGRFEAIKFLVESGCDVNILSNQGLPAVLMAAVSSCDEGVKCLVEKGADIGHIVSGNTSALHICAEHGLYHAVAAIILTDIGTKCCDMETSEGNLSIHLAAMAGHRNIVELLMNKYKLNDKYNQINDSINKIINSDTSIVNNDNNGEDIDDMMTEGCRRMAVWEKTHGNNETDTTSSVVPTVGTKNTNLEPTTAAKNTQDVAEADFWKGRGNVAFLEKDYKKACEAYTNAIKLQGDNGALWSNRSACYNMMGDRYLEEALADAEVCRRLMPSWSKACFRLAKARLAMKQYEDAALAAFEGCKLDDKNEGLKDLLREAVKLGQEEHQRKLQSN